MEKKASKGRGRPPRGDAMKERIFVLTNLEMQQKLEKSREISGKTTSDLVRIGLDWAYAVLTGKPPEFLTQLESQLRTSKKEQKEWDEISAHSAYKEKPAQGTGTGTKPLPKPTEPKPEEAPKRPLPSHLL